MSSLQGKKIFPGISAGIAAYKSLSLIRLSNLIFFDPSSGEWTNHVQLGLEYDLMQKNLVIQF